MPQYINDVSESNISRVSTINNTSQIEVFYKVEKKLRTLSGLEIAEFLNQTTDSKNNGRNRAITKNVEEGIICNVTGIYKDKNGEYQYIEPTLNLMLRELVVKLVVNQMTLVQQKYQSLFQNQQAISLNLNYIVSNSISNIPKLKERYEKILGLDPRIGSCQSLSYFVTLTGLSSKKDFSMLLKSADMITEQDIIDCLSGKKEKTYQLFTILVLSQCLPALNVHNIEKRENHELFNDILFCKLKCFPHLTITKQIISLEEQKELECILYKAKSGCYIELICSYCSDYTSSEKANYETHSMLIYTKNGKCFFFDSNYGVTGLHPETGLPNLTPKEVCDIVVSAVDFYSSEQLGRSQNASSLGEQAILIRLRNASLAMEKAESFYNTTENPNSQIVEISIDEKTSGLLFTPVLP